MVTAQPLYITIMSSHKQAHTILSTILLLIVLNVLPSAPSYALDETIQDVLAKTLRVISAYNNSYLIFVTKLSSICLSLNFET